ncbi:MFS transporter [Nakamurella sp. A5-74]|uniref:MFS transporter n=1 Tax=Nakamurella sp. A5-74 TaxID=3158264 RepID=A0AAU8DNS9_9ACTN
MKRALAHPLYRRLFLAQVLSLAGTGLATVALGLLAYDIAGAGAGQVLGTIFAIKMIAYVLVAPIAAAVVARWPRRAVMIGSDSLRLLVAASLPFVGVTWQVYLLVFVLQSASATFTPTFQSVIPDVLTDEEDYTAALSLSRMAYDLEAVLSPMLAAVLLVLIPSSALFFGTAAGFAASAALVLGSRLPGRSDGGTDTDEVPAPFWSRVRRGAVLFTSTPALRPVLALNLAVAATGAFVLVQTVVIVRSLLHQGDGLVAVMLAINGAGSMTAAFVLPRVLRTVPEKRLMLGGAVVLTAAVAAVPLALTASGVPAGLSIGALWLAVGIGWASAETPVGRILRRAVADRDLPAAFAAQFSLSHACWLITYPVAGWLGAIDLDLAAGVLAVVAAVATITAAALWPSAGRAGRSVVAPQQLSSISQISDRSPITRSD